MSYNYQKTQVDFLLKESPTRSGSQRYGPCEFCKKSADSISSFSLHQKYILITDDPIINSQYKGNINRQTYITDIFAHPSCSREWARLAELKIRSQQK